MLKKFTSKHLKIQLTSLRNAQSGEQLEQNEYHSTPGLDGSPEYKVPRRSQIDRQPGEQVHQNDYYSAPGTYPPNGNGSQQFRVPGTPFFGIPETPLSSIPTTRMPAIPLPGVAETPLSSMPTTRMPAISATSWSYPPPANVDSRIQERVKFYADWLAKHARYDELNDNSKEINDYIQEATKIVKVGEKEVAIFAPFRPKLFALQTFTTRQVVALCIIGLLWIIGLLVFRLEMLTVVIAAITVLYTFNLILSASMALRTFQNSPEERISDAIVH